MNAVCAGKTVRSLENACHTIARYDQALYKSTFTFALYVYATDSDIVVLVTTSFNRSAGLVIIHHIVTYIRMAYRAAIWRPLYPVNLLTMLFDCINVVFY